MSKQTTAIHPPSVLPGVLTRATGPRDLVHRDPDAAPALPLGMCQAAIAWLRARLANPALNRVTNGGEWDDDDLRHALAGYEAAVVARLRAERQR